MTSVSSDPTDDPVYELARRGHVQYIKNPNTMMCDFWDGTSVAQEIVDNVNHILDVFYIIKIRDQQRKAIKK